MVEPVTTVGLGAIAAYLSKDGLSKLLGPTADYLGGGLRDFTKERVSNIGKIFSSAEKKLGDKVNTPGQVPPKVLKTIMNEGSYSTDNLATEYFGGILASARTEHGRDDRGARLAKILDSLTTYQLRAHYLIYSTVRRIFKDKNLPFNITGRPQMQIFIPFEEYFALMEFDGKEMEQAGQLLNHVFFGLHGDSLIDTTWRYGQREQMTDIFSSAPSGGIVCGPSALGAELFLSAFGHAELPLEAIFDMSLAMSIEGISDGFSSAVPTQFPSTEITS